MNLYKLTGTAQYGVSKAPIEVYSLALTIENAIDAFYDLHNSKHPNAVDSSWFLKGVEQISSSVAICNIALEFLNSDH